ncbi:ABC transporter permease [Mongoliimonas terrestris]|uniref:ABC transporter permease n=1 Tax=Mongoliimonas terrestris TaxID=1709001 RepID=UPI000B22571F|nr:ABC transporter permease [Mongoliimonas terrestris]
MSAVDLAATKPADVAARTGRTGIRARTARIATGALIALLLLPFVPVLLWSVTRGWFYPAILPPALDLAAWGVVGSPESGIPAAVLRSVGIALGATVLSMLIGVPAGRALGLHAFPGRRWVEALVLAPLVVPPLAVAMGLHAVFLRLGLAGTATGVMIVHLIPTLPYVVLVSASVFSRFDPRVEDQARTLGASRLQVLRHVTVPMLAPGLAVAALFAFLVSWSQYGLTLLVGGGQVPTMPLILNQYVTAGRSDVAAAIALLTVLPGLVALVLSARILARASRRDGEGGR